MVDKKKLHSDIKKLQRVKTWHLVVLLVLAAFLAATFLRLNNIGMVERRSAVVSADEAGDSEIIKDRLYDLQRYVTSHMNTNLGRGIFLENSYKKDLKSSYESVQTDSEVYQLVQDYCEPKFSHWSQAYVQCVIDKLAEYPEAKTPIMPETSAYIHNFISPIWSPDFAGLSVLICIALLLMIIARITGYFVLRAILKYRHPLI